MYDNIGGKLKGLAKVTFCIGAISSGISGVMTLFVSPLVGIIIIGVGFLASWISSWMTYAVGEIAENSEAALNKVDSLERKCQAVLHANAQTSMPQGNMQQAVPVKPATEAKKNVGNSLPVPVTNEDGSWTCPRCKRNNMASRDTCWSCDYVKQ